MNSLSAPAGGRSRLGHPHLERFGCPSCGTDLRQGEWALTCAHCGTDYPVRDGVYDLRPIGRSDHGETEAWTKHWADENQSSLSQRFFSTYRKTVFARTVAYFVEQYLAPEGLLIEAGSGTSESSILIDKHAGSRSLAAIDLIPSVLQRCDPVMDIRVCGDIFRLPFQENSVDGAWNVGVMEHFLPTEIDQILLELHRVLRPGGRLVLLWPGRDSLPQRMLRAVEFAVNLRREDGDRFRFHPDEISQLRSLSEGRTILERNGFRWVSGDAGPRSLMAFKIVVGEKPDPSPSHTRRM